MLTDTLGAAVVPRGFNAGVPVHVESSEQRHPPANEHHWAQPDGAALHHPLRPDNGGGGARCFESLEAAAGVYSVALPSAPAAGRMVTSAQAATHGAAPS